MIFSVEYLERLSDATGFQLGSLEKQMHLLHVLREIRRHPYLKDQFALKGGTAINIFLQSMPRLSVDIDLNYVGAKDVDDMLAARPEIDQALEQLVEDIGFSVDYKPPPTSHAGGKWILVADSALGDIFTLELDINFAYRIPLGDIQYLKPYDIDEEYTVPFPIVSTRELYAGKILALLNRGAVRDLYDTQRALVNGILEVNNPLKYTLLFLGLAQPVDWRQVTPQKLQEITAKQIDVELTPMLTQDDPFDLETAQSAVTPFLEALLDYSEDERECIDLFLTQGEFRPELLLDDQEEIQRFRNHPAILWRLQKLRQYHGIQ